MALPAFGTAVPPPRAQRSVWDDDEITLRFGEVSCWSINGKTYQAIPGSTPTIPPAFYQVGVDSYGTPKLTQMDIQIDDLIELPDPVTEMLFMEFEKFWTAADKMRALGLTLKRGILMYGPPGSGKTSAIQTMAAHTINKLGGVVIMADKPEHTSACLHMIRRIEKTRPIISVYEDVDSLVEMYGESGYLSLLDGENQISGVVNVATTNYPERLDKRFVDRPGRFDRVQEVGMPSRKAREVYLKTRLPDLPAKDREMWLDASDDWSIAHLRELVVSTQALGESVKDAIERLDGMRMSSPKSDGNGGTAKSVGFQRD